MHYEMFVSGQVCVEAYTGPCWPRINQFKPVRSRGSGDGELLLNPGSPASVPSFPALTNEGDNRIVGGGLRG